MAQYAWSKGWRTAALATDTVIVYFKNVCRRSRPASSSSAARSSTKETYQSLGGNNVQNAVSRLNGVKADVIVTSTAGAFGALSTLVSGLRALGNNTPILNSWAGDGTYWLPEEPEGDELLLRHVRVGASATTRTRRSTSSRSRSRRAPAASSPARPRSTASSPRSSGRTARRTARRSRRRWRSSRRCRRSSGHVSFSPKLHTVFGRQYRVIRIQNNEAKLVGTSSPRSSRRSRVGGWQQHRETRAEARRHAPGLRRLALVRRACRRCATSTLELRRGEVVGLIGPNGAGKSTLVNVLSGFDRPDDRHGRARAASDVTRLAAHRRGPARARADVPAQPRVPRALACARTSRSPRSASGAGPRRGARAAPTSCSGLLGLARTRTRPPAALAHGDERRLGVARALATEPRFVLMDEPAAGLPEAEVPEFAAVVRSVARRPRRRRAADRPQHGADHGGLRPHPRARPGRDARRGDAGRDPRQPRRRRRVPRRERRSTTRSRRMTVLASRTSRSATAPCAPCAASRSRCEPGEIVGLIGPNGAGKSSTLHAIMGLVAGRRRRGPPRRRVAARPPPGGRRPQRRRARARGAADLRRADRRGEPPPRPRGAARAQRRGASDSSAVYELFPVVARVPRPHARARSRAASSSSSRSRARSSPSPTCCCSTSRRSGSRRASSTPSSRRWRRSASAASRCCSSSSARSGRSRSPTARTCSRTASCALTLTPRGRGRHRDARRGVLLMIARDPQRRLADARRRDGARRDLRADGGRDRARLRRPAARQLRLRRS